MNEEVTCRRCGVTGEYTLHKSPFPFVPYIDYRKGSDNFYLCQECSYKWLTDVSQKVSGRDNVRKAFIEYVEGKEALSEYVCPHCGKFYD